MFALPGIDLSDVTIPLRELDGDRLPTGREVREMVSEVSRSLLGLRTKTSMARLDEIKSQLDSFEVDPVAWDGVLKQPSLRDGGCGTHFYIQPADTIMQGDIDDRQGERKANSSGANPHRFHKHDGGRSDRADRCQDSAITARKGRPKRKSAKTLSSLRKNSKRLTIISQGHLTSTVNFAERWAFIK